jgi:hypothetical protein
VSEARGSPETSTIRPLRRRVFARITRYTGDDEATDHGRAARPSHTRALAPRPRARRWGRPKR